MLFEILTEILIIAFHFPVATCGFRIGTVFREKEDAHLVAALNFSLQWLKKSSAAEDSLVYEASVELLQRPDDHYELVEKVCKLVDNNDGIVALIGPADRDLSLQMSKIASSLGLPFLMLADTYSHHRFDSAENYISDDEERHEHSTMIPIFPRLFLIEAISDLIKHWRWKQVFIVYSEDRRIPRLVPFLENSAYNEIRFYFIRIDRGNFLEAAKTIKRLVMCPQSSEKECSDYNRMLLDLNPTDTYKFLIANLQVGAIHLKNWFLLTSLDLKSMDLELFRHNHARFIGLDVISMAFAKAHRDSSFSYEEFERAVSSSSSGGQYSKKRTIKMSESALLFDSVLLIANALTSVNKQYPLDPVERVKCANGIKPTKPFRYSRQFIRAIYENKLFGLTGNLGRVNPTSYGANFSFGVNLLGYDGVIQNIGYWEPVTDVNIDMARDARAQLQQNVKVSDELKPHFQVTTILERPYVMFKTIDFDYVNSNDVQFEGFCIDLLQELANDLGFTYSIHVVRDNKYGNQLRNGSWNGMIGEILRGEADMVVGPFTATYGRAEAVDFTKPFLSLGISILYRIPLENHHPDLFSFLNPLSFEIWMCILLSICGLTFGMYLVAQITPYEWNLNFSCCTAHQPYPAAHFATSKNMVLLSNNYSFWNTLWYVMSTMLKGGCDFGPRAVSTRLLGASWWMFTLVIVAAYTANLAAVLTVSRPHISIRNLDDLANQTDISYGTIQGGSTMQFFQESKIGSHVQMWNQMRKKTDVFVRNNREGVNKVLNEKYAYLMESSSLEYEVQQNCNLTQIGGVLGSKGYGIALQKSSDSEWTEKISHQILLYQKRGVIEMKKTKWWRPMTSGSCSVGSSVKQQRISLSLKNVSGLFIVLAIGVLFSIFIVAVEFYVWREEKGENKSQ